MKIKMTQGLKRALLSVILSGMLLLSGCSTAAQESSVETQNSTDSSSVSSTPTDESRNSSEPSVEESKVNDIQTKNVINLDKGDTYDLKIDLLDSGIDLSLVIFSSADETVAPIDDSGIITAKRIGVAEILVRDSNMNELMRYVVHVTEKAVPRVNTITPLVWEVTSPEGGKIYMMGSVHCGDKSVENMPDYFESAFENCDALAVECDISSAAAGAASMIGYIGQLTYLDGSTIQDHVPVESYQKAVSYLKDAGMYVSYYDRLKPFMWSSLIESAVIKNIGLSTDYGIDSILIDRAHKNKMELLEIESVEFQMQMVVNMNEAIQEMIFASYTTYGMPEEMENTMETLYDHWKSGTLTAEEVAGDVDLSGEGSLTEQDQQTLEKYKPLLEEYNKIMLYDRNEGMVKKAKEYIQSGKTVMFVVGMGHFLGDKGIQQLLEAEGYTFRPLTTKDAGNLSADTTPVNRESSAPVHEETDPAVPKAA